MYSQWDKLKMLFSGKYCTTHWVRIEQMLNTRHYGCLECELERLAEREPEI